MNAPIEEVRMIAKLMYPDDDDPIAVNKRNKITTRGIISFVHPVFRDELETLIEKLERKNCTLDNERIDSLKAEYSDKEADAHLKHDEPLIYDDGTKSVALNLMQYNKSLPNRKKLYMKEINPMKKIRERLTKSLRAGLFKKDRDNAQKWVDSLETAFDGVIGTRINLYPEEENNDTAGVVALPTIPQEQNMRTPQNNARQPPYNASRRRQTQDIRQNMAPRHLERE